MVHASSNRADAERGAPRRARRASVAVSAGLVLLLLGGVLRAADSGEIARDFAVRFLKGEDASLRTLMAPRFRAALGGGVAEGIRRDLKTKFGAVRTVGAADKEDVVDGFARFRVPVTFEHGRADLRVVLDEEGQVAGLFVLPTAPSLDEARPPDGVREEEIRIGGKTGLPGTLSLPAGEGPFPGAVIVHGSGPLDRDGTVGPNKPYRDLAWGLAARGVAVLRYDKRSHARPHDLAALGDRLTVKQETTDDAVAAIDVLTGRPEIDRERVYVLGHSLGGALAPRIAKRSGAVTGLVVLAAPATPLPEKILAQVKRIAAMDGETSAEEAERIGDVERQVAALRAALKGEADPPEGHIFGAPFAYYLDLDAYDAPALARELALPILVVQGSRDHQVGDEDFRRWMDGLEKQPFATPLLYPRLDHLLRDGKGPSRPEDYEQEGQVAEILLDDVAKFLKRD